MDREINRRFLRMLGWEGEELESFMPEWIAAAKLLELTDDDVRYACDEWIPQYWNISLQGVRKMIAACIREAAELAKLPQYLAEGKKVMYSNNISSFPGVYANKLAGKGQLFVAYPDFIMTTLWQAFFGKPQNNLQDKPVLSQTCSHCALNCIRAATSTARKIPTPTVTWTWGLYCNEGPKTEELIDCLSERNEASDVLTSIPHDAPLGEIEAENPARVNFLAAQIRESQQRVSELTGVEVTDGDMRRAIDEYLEYLRRVEKLTKLVVTADPQPISGIELSLFCMNLQVCFADMSYVIDALDTMIDEVQRCISRGEGILPKGSPRLACHFAPMNLPWIDKAFRENGVNLSLGRMFPLASWIEEAIKDDDDPYVAAARICLMCPDAVNMKNAAKIVTRHLQSFSFDGALFGFYEFDRWIGALHKTMIRLIEDATGVPHFYLEGEFWDGSKYSIEDRNSIIRSICSCLKISGM